MTQSSTVLIDHMHRRLLRWADWSSRGRRASGLWYARCPLAAWGEASEGSVPDVTLDVEASDTDRAITHLPDDLRAAVRAYYLGRGTLEQRAQDCLCHKNTLCNRVARAQGRLAGLLDAMRQERVQAVEEQKFVAWRRSCALARGEC